MARSTFQVLDRSLYTDQSRCTTLPSFSNSPATANSWNPTPARRAMPGDYFEAEDSDTTLLNDRTCKVAISPRSPKHHINAETSLLMAELAIGESESQMFSYVVEVALRSDLPPPWKKKVDPHGATYYLDVDNETTTWSSPLLPYLKQVVEAGRLYLKEPSDKYFEQIKSKLWLAHVKELEGWHGPLKSDEGHSYFWNSESQRSTWHDPRLSAQFYCDLQNRLLKHLETSFTAAQDTDDSPFDASRGPPWEMKTVGKGQFSARGYATDTDNQQLMLADQPQAVKVLGQKATRVNQMMEASYNHKEQSFMMHKMSNTAEWVRGASEAEENVQRSRLTQKRVRMLEDKKVRDRSREIAEAIHDPAINSAVFLGTAPLEIRDPWIVASAPLESTKPWEVLQARSHVGWQPWELWTKELWTKEM